jgi:hypothetical protein
LQDKATGHFRNSGKQFAARRPLDSPQAIHCSHTQIPAARRPLHSPQAVSARQPRSPQAARQPSGHRRS